MHEKDNYLKTAELSTEQKSQLFRHDRPGTEKGQ